MSAPLCGLSKSVGQVHYQYRYLLEELDLI